MQASSLGNSHFAERGCVRSTSRSAWKRTTALGILSFPGWFLESGDFVVVKRPDRPNRQENGCQEDGNRNRLLLLPSEGEKAGMRGGFQ